jgi:hypothetical protein
MVCVAVWHQRAFSEPPLMAVTGSLPACSRARVCGVTLVSSVCPWSFGDLDVVFIVFVAFLARRLHGVLAISGRVPLRGITNFFRRFVWCAACGGRSFTLFNISFM